jgi:hypothetical protein
LSETLFIFFLFVNNVLWIVANSDSSCEPADEFENDITTDEWNTFMDEVTKLTFETNLTLPCKTNKSATVVIDQKSDFLWDLRFMVYNERQQSDGKTINDCYSESQKVDDATSCPFDSFRECMKQARTDMLNDLNSVWENKVDEKLKQLSEEC